MRSINDDVGHLRIIAEHARIRQPVPRLPSSDLDFLHNRPVVDDSKEPIRNVLELSNRYEIDIDIGDFSIIAFQMVAFRFVVIIAKSKGPLLIQLQCISLIR